MTDQDDKSADTGNAPHSDISELKPDGDGSADSDRDSDPQGATADGYGDHAAVAHAGGEGHGSHGMAHMMPVSLLVGVLSALLVLTVLTVSVTSYDLGSEGNLVVALVIATIKAGLVVTFFMHLAWDRRFNLLAFLSAVLFAILFLSLTITDRSENQPMIDQYLQAQPQK
jgi:cytochrome c oxidase subunit 4